MKNLKGNKMKNIKSYLLFLTIYSLLLTFPFSLLYAEGPTTIRAVPGLGVGIKNIKFDENLNLYEVAGSDGMIYYMSKDYRYVFVGTMLDTKTGKNITEERKAEIFRIDFSELSLQNAIKIPSRKKSSKEIAVFTDPTCPWCRKLHNEFKKLDDVTIYIFLINGYPNSREINRLVWCSNDKINTLNKVYEGEKIDETKIKNIKETNKVNNCNDSVADENMKFLRKQGILSFPIIFFENGKRHPGYVPHEKLAELIEKNSNKGAK